MQSIIKRSRVAYREVPLPAIPAEKESESAPVACEKNVELVKIDGEVRAIEVRCSCGEVSTIELQYENAGGQQ